MVYLNSACRSRLHLEGLGSDIPQDVIDAQEAAWPVLPWIPATPTATITMSDTALTTGETAVVTAQFSMPVLGLALGDFTAESGVLSDLVAVSSSLYTATFTPTAATTDATNVISLTAASYTNEAGVVGAAAAGPNYTVAT